MKPEDIDKFIAKRDELIQKGVEFFKEKTIGEHVVEIIQQRRDLSIDELMRSLQETIDKAPSSERRKAEAALAYLRSIIQEVE